MRIFRAYSTFCSTVIFLDITVVLVIVNIVSIRIRLCSFLFLLLILALHKDETTAADQGYCQNTNDRKHIGLVLFIRFRLCNLRLRFGHFGFRLRHRLLGLVNIAERFMRSSNMPYNSFASIDTFQKRSSVNSILGIL